MSRNAPTVLALLLLTATATAFAVTQRLKLEPSPISQTRVAKVFSPVCECRSHAATIQFSLRRADHLRIAIRLGTGQVTISDGEFRRGLVHARWNGRDAAGAVVPDGIYHAVVHMRRAQRTIDLPNPIRVDTEPPTITVRSVSHHGLEWKFRYTISEPAHAILFVDGQRALFTFSTRRRGHFTWHGHVQGRPVFSPKRLVLEAEDVAGNRSLPERIQTV